MSAVAALFLSVLLLAGCQEKAKEEEVRVVGSAFVGPLTAPIRRDLTPRSPELKTLKHGDPVELIERRRRFYRVRHQGAIGWMDGRALLTATQMEEIRQLAAEHANTPSIGQATVYESLNLHNVPGRSTPSFAQIPEKGVVDMLLYRTVPRVPYQPPPLIEDVKPVPKKARKKGKDKKDPEVEPPPAPQAPELPDDWEDLSEPGRELSAPTNGPGVKTDDWTLVRMKDGKVGWALSGMLAPAIPDDVAQYSEGHRIIGYWPLKEDQDGAETKAHWLWVTRQKGSTHTFDGFRVFLYNPRRHRYEQAYREKNVAGYFPVEVTRPGRKPEYLAEFSVITDDKEGRKMKRTFAYLGYRILKLDEQPWVEPRAATPKAAPVTVAPVPAEKPWYRRLF